jgi:hypothetical protein
LVAALSGIPEALFNFSMRLASLPRGERRGRVGPEIGERVAAMILTRRI